MNKQFNDYILLVPQLLGSDVRLDMWPGPSFVKQLNPGDDLNNALKWALSGIMELTINNIFLGYLYYI